MEGEVAGVFGAVRSAAKLEPLIRINHRDGLEQRVCAMASSGVLPTRHYEPLVAFYTTADPRWPSPEVTAIASFNRQTADGKVIYPRYSVAVWRVNDSQAGHPTYWVGVGRYPSALYESVDNHFTDEALYHNDWKKSIPVECRRK
jgi:hypothetical protein